jgi:hypothetical protein
VLQLLLRAGVVLTVLSAGIAGNVLLVKGQNDLLELMAGAALVTLAGLVAVERSGHDGGTSASAAHQLRERAAAGERKSALAKEFGISR